MAAKQNDKQTKTHEHPYTRMNNHVHPWTPMSTWARMSTHELTWIRVFPNTMQLANYLLNHMSHSFWTSYFGLLAMWVFDLIILFLNWTLISFLCFICFCFVLWWLRAPKKILADFCKTWFVLFIFLKLSIYSYLFIQIYLYIYIHMYVYINIYLHMCIYIYVCVCKFMYLYIYI